MEIRHRFSTLTLLPFDEWIAVIEILHALFRPPPAGEGSLCHPLLVIFHHLHISPRCMPQVLCAAGCRQLHVAEFIRTITCFCYKALFEKWPKCHLVIGHSNLPSICFLDLNQSEPQVTLSNPLSFDRVNNLVCLFILTFNKHLSNAVKVPYLLCGVTWWNFLKVLWIMQLFSGVGTAQTCQKKLYWGNWKSEKFTSVSIYTQSMFGECCFLSKPWGNWPLSSVIRQTT